MAHIGPAERLTSCMQPSQLVFDLTELNGASASMMVAPKVSITKKSADLPRNEGPWNKIQVERAEPAVSVHWHTACTCFSISHLAAPMTYLFEQSAVPHEKVHMENEVQ